MIDYPKIEGWRNVANVIVTGSNEKIAAAATIHDAEIIVKARNHTVEEIFYWISQQSTTAQP